MSELKITVVTSNSTAVPLISMLAQRHLLAGVLLLGEQNQERAVMEGQLKQSGIPVQYCPPGDYDKAITALTAWQNQLGLVFCCSEKLPITLVNTPPHGMVNLHASALPDYRGANPIYWQIRHGQTDLMLTAHQVDETLDTGPIITQRAVTIGPYDTPNRVFSSLIQQIPSIVDALTTQLQQQGHLTTQPQQGETQHKAPRVTESDLLINWRHLSATELCNQVRAGNPIYGGARLVMGQGQAQLLQASPSALPTYGATPGTIIQLSPEQGLTVALKEESVRLDIISNTDGTFDGYRFAQTCKLSAGMQFQ